MKRAFEGKVAWITGASSGIGEACAVELARQGASLALSGRRSERLEAIAERIRADGGTAMAVPCDVTQEAQVESAVKRVVAELGRLDVVLANAGFSVMGYFEKLEVDDWRRQFDTNVFGLIATVRHALPELHKTGGRIGLTGSVSAFLPSPKAGPYVASKAAVRAIGETLSIELAGSGVSCTTLHPGFVESEIGQVDNQGDFHPERVDKRPRQLMWSAERAAKVMVRALARRKREEVFTGHGKFAVAVARHTPGLASGVQRIGQRRQRPR